MASTSSINSNSSGSQAPNPPPRTHSRPNQPPPPPPLPSVPPVPPTRDSSISISKSVISKHSQIPAITTNTTSSPNQSQAQTVISTVAQNGLKFLSQFEHLFKPIDELPLPEPFMNKTKSYPSQRAQQKQTVAPKIQT